VNKVSRKATINSKSDGHNLAWEKCKIDCKHTGSSSCLGTFHSITIERWHTWTHTRAHAWTFLPQSTIDHS